MSYEGWEKDVQELEEALAEAHAYGLQRDHKHLFHQEKWPPCAPGCIRGCGACEARLRALENLAGAEE